MFNFLRSRFTLKLFLTYLLVLVTSIGVMALVTNLAASGTFQRHMMNPEQVQNAAGQGWMGGRPTNTGGMGMQLFQSYRNSINEGFIYASLAAFLVAVVVSLLTSRWVVKPIKAMISASRHIAEGHYSERIPIGRDNATASDELGELAASFNQMAEKLEQNENIRRQLLGDVTHELRTPLTTIKGSMEALIDGVIEPEPAVFQQIHTEASRLQRLVEDLQEISRLEAGAFKLEPKPLSLPEVIAHTVALLQPQYDAKQVSLRFTPANEVTVLADPDRLKQVLVNLLGNALQYTNSGGHVAISFDSRHHDAEVTITDDGIGLPADQLEHIFTRFYRVDKSRSRSRGGSGVGLTVTRTLVEAMGGTIHAESAGIGMGSTFRFTLPLS